MADILEQIAAHPATGTPLTKTVKWVDMGDGTHAESVDLGDRANRILGRLSANAGVNIGTVSIASMDAGALGYTTATHTKVDVVAGSVLLLAANANRKYALIVNDSVTDMYISLGTAAVPYRGIRINANGGSYEMSGQQGNLYRGAIYCDHTAGGAVTRRVLVTEGV